MAEDTLAFQDLSPQGESTPQKKTLKGQLKDRMIFRDYG